MIPLLYEIYWWNQLARLVWLILGKSLHNFCRRTQMSWSNSKVFYIFLQSKVIRVFANPPSCQKYKCKCPESPSWWCPLLILVVFQSIFFILQIWNILMGLGWSSGLLMPNFIIFVAFNLKVHCIIIILSLWSWR